MTSDRRGQGRETHPPRGKAAMSALLSGLLLAAAGCTALGMWQVHRLHWKLALIQRVDSRIHATPAPAPGMAEWPRVGVARDEYRRVRLSGRFLPGRDTRVQALTELGAGYWVLTPFRTAAGDTVLVNRGFAPPDWQDTGAPDRREITGLLRLPEPGGTLLRHNDPAAGRWYSRDVQAIAAARGLGGVAPYFVDEDDSALPPAGDTLPGNATAWPRAGLTVVRFSNHHLGYALTWFALALMSAGAAIHVVRSAARQGHAAGPSDAREEPFT